MKQIPVDHATFEILEKGESVVLDRDKADKLLGKASGFVDIFTKARSFHGQVIECIVSKGMVSTTISVRKEKKGK